MRARLALAVLAAAGIATGASAATASNDATAHAGQQTVTQAQAKSRILAENYTNVTDMKRTAQGWTAKAKDLGAPVTLLVNDRESVSQI